MAALMGIEGKLNGNINEWNQLWIDRYLMSLLAEEGEELSKEQRRDEILSKMWW